MSQTSYRQQGEQTGSVGPALTEEEERESQMEEEMQRQTWPLPIALLLNHSIILRVNTQQLLVALLRNGPGSETARDMEMGRGREGNVCEGEVEREGWSKWGERRVFVLWISAEPALTSTDLTDGTSSGLFQMTIAVWLWSSVSFIHTHVATLHHLVLLSKPASERHFMSHYSRFVHTQ